DRHGDAAIALCMAYAASRAEHREYAYHPVASPRRAASAGRRGGFMRPDHSGDERPLGRRGGDARWNRGAL
ncbi:MAG: hypothetical protein OXI15_09045, partial [Chromatiales bacterium]|nr:hypothetical protein [Chromatiales bacterium]